MPSVNKPIESSILRPGRVWTIKYRIFFYFPFWEQWGSWGNISRIKFFGLSSMCMSEDHNSYWFSLTVNLESLVGTELKSVLTLLEGMNIQIFYLNMKLKTFNLKQGWVNPYPQKKFWLHKAFQIMYCITWKKK